MTIGTMVFLGVGKGRIGVEVGDSAYDESGNDKTEQNIENKRNPPIATPPIVVKTQKGVGFGVTDNGNFFIPIVKIKRKKLFRRMNGVTINEIIPHHPKSIVLPVRFQK